MNCQEFKENIITLARGRNYAESAPAHAAQCPACAAQLRQMQSLSQGLAMLRDADAQHNASFATETALRAVFRAQAESRQQAAGSRQQAADSKQAVASSVAISDSHAPSRKVWSNGPRRVWWMRGAALAASLAVCVTTYGLWRSSANSAPTSTAATVIASPTVPQTVIQAEKVATIRPEETKLAPVSKSVAPSVTAPQSATLRTARAPMRPTAANKLPSTQTAKMTRPTPKAKKDTPEVFANHSQEIATEYFTLNNAPTLQPTDEVNIVRVKLPRTAMAAFGLPVNENRASEQVTADVVIGPDGMARAIRFIR